MLNKISTMSILLLVAIALIVFFGVKNGKTCSVTTTTKPSTTTDTGTTTTNSSFRGRKR